MQVSKEVQYQNISKNTTEQTKQLQSEHVRLKNILGKRVPDCHNDSNNNHNVENALKKNNATSTLAALYAKIKSKLQALFSNTLK